MPVASQRPSGPHAFHPYRGVLRRFFLLLRHLLALSAGAVLAHVDALPAERRRGLRSAGSRLGAALLRRFLHPDLAGLTWPGQLRRRLEMLGPTYVKLGQILAVREDLLPKAITDELKNLFEHLPELPFEQIRGVVESSLQRRIEDLFERVEVRALGSASIAQVHRATTRDGERVVLKVMKPGIREAIRAELKLLQLLGRVLQGVIPQYQPHYLIEEFSSYTLREIDFAFEADNGEIFAANFRDLPDVVFPRIYRELSSEDVLTMEFLDGFRPGSPATFELSGEQRARVIELGAGSIIRMLYQHGFFHADLHAGNLVILPGDPIRIGFIDLGMVGRFEERTRRRMLYYFHALVSGDVEAAAKYLSVMAKVGKGGDPAGFRRAVTDLSRRFAMHSAQGGFSIARLILESMGLGGKYRVFFPVELILMVKALVTFEGVGRMLDPKLDVVAISREHVARIFREQFYPRALSRELLRSTLRNSPELLDFVAHVPELLTEAVRSLEEIAPEPPPQERLSGIRSSIIAAACILGGALMAAQGGPVLLWSALLLIGIVLYLVGG